MDLLSDARAKATTTIHELVRAVEFDLNEERHGIYFDEVANFDGNWRFVRRLFVPFLVATERVAGDVATERPVLRPA